jgi:chloramphenicol O-acetyltransferase
MYNLTPEARARMSDEERKPIYEKYIKYLEENYPNWCIDNNCSIATIREALEHYGLGFFEDELGAVEVTALEDYQLLCKMKTGETKMFDMKPYLNQTYYQSLKDIAVFNSVYVEYGFLHWSNGKVDMGFDRVLLHGVDVKTERAA